jgi:flagellar hook-associated protein 2
LEDIASQINETAGDDVSATVVNSGTTTSPSWRLVLTSKSSGEEGRITNLTSSVAGLVADGTGATAGGVPQSRNHLTVGLNAVAVIDGLRVERSTNEFNDVIEGLSITVESADELLEMSFSVQPDTDAVKDKLQEFVDSYNKIIGFINQQNTYNEDTGPGGDLFGDSVLSSVRREIDTALFGVDLGNVQADTLGYSTLGLVGIKRNSDGTLLIDAAKFDEKLEQNLSAFMDLFVDTDGFDNGGAAENTPEYYQDTTADTGLAARLDRSIDRMLNSATGPNGLVLKGLFDAKNEALNDKVKRFDDQIEAKQFYLERYENQLIERFSKLEDIMGGLNAQGAALSAALNGLIR